MIPFEESEGRHIRRSPSETRRTVQKSKRSTALCIRLLKHKRYNVVTASKAPRCGILCACRQVSAKSCASLICRSHSTLCAVGVRCRAYLLCFRQTQDRLQRRASGAVALWLDFPPVRIGGCRARFCFPRYNVRASLSRNLSCGCPVNAMVCTHAKEFDTVSVSRERYQIIYLLAFLTLILFGSYIFRFHVL